MVTIARGSSPPDPEALNLLFGALSDETRRGILERLAHGAASVGEIAAPFDMSRPAISKHLRVLERAGLVERERDGRISRCSLQPEPMRSAASWIERYRGFWEHQLDALSRYLEREAGYPAEETEDG
jgi:DNA-binding transcriptional ArsR family regulator